jgi:hypothetical protein
MVPLLLDQTNIKRETEQSDDFSLVLGGPL